MKRFMSLLMVIAIMASLTIGFSGCESPESVQSIALVACARENFTSLSFDKNSEAYAENSTICESIYDDISEAFYSYGNAYAVTTEGIPVVCAENSFDKPEAFIDSAKRKQLANKEAKEFFEEFEQNAVAEVGEVDTLQAITKAADAVNGSDATEKTILVVDSGLSTSGYVDFASKNIFDADIGLFVDRLLDKHAIPDLKGIELIWIGLGETAGDQESLPSEQRFKLKEIWTAILTASGAESFDFRTTPLKMVSYNGKLPDVKEVPVFSSDVNDGVIKLSIGFISDTDQILDRAAAEAELAKLLDSLERNPSLDVVVAGSCASVGSGGKELSEKRAYAVKKLLCDRGIDESRITAVGLGSTKCSLRVDDLNDDGTLNEELAQANRAVFVYNADSQIAKEIDGLLRFG